MSPEKEQPEKDQPENERPEKDQPEGDQAGPEATAGADLLNGCPVVDSLGARVVHCNVESYKGLMGVLKDDGYDLFVGLTGVDYLTHPGRSLPDGIRPERFEVVVELVNVATKERIRARCQVCGVEPVAPTLFDLWAGSEAHERETFDMFGVRFEGHPDLTRILMPEDWEGYPLRKDYSTGRVPVQFKETPERAR